MQDGLQYHDPADPSATQPKSGNSSPPSASVSWKNRQVEFPNEQSEPLNQPTLQPDLLSEIITLFLDKGADVSIQDKVRRPAPSFRDSRLRTEWEEYLSPCR